MTDTNLPFSISNPFEPTVEELFSSLEDSANSLNSFSDECNQLIEKVEKRLISLNIGLEFWYEDESIYRGDLTGNAGRNTISTHIVKQLGFCRINGSWALAVKTVRCESGFYQGDLGCPFENRYKEEEPIRLSGVSRELRINSVAILTSFLSEYNRFVRDKVSEIEKTQKLIS